MTNEKQSGLRRTLSPMSVWAIAFGCIIGWGSFINPGKKFLPNSGVAGTTIAMILGALVMVVIAVSYAYMVPKYPRAGGEFTFTKECFGKIPAFVCGWFLVAAYLTNVPMNSTAIGLIIDGIFGPVLKWGFHYTIAGFEVWLGEIIVAGGILILFGILNILGVKKAAFVQTVLASLLILCVFTLFIAALVSPHAKVENMAPWWGFDKKAAVLAGTYDETLANQSWISAILATFAIAPWAFVGFDAIPQASEEFKFSYKKVIFIMVIAIAFGCFVYCSNNAITAAALENWPELIVDAEGTPWLLLSAAEKMLGVWGKVLVGVGVSCAVLSGIMGFYLASSRLMYSMAKDGFLPAAFGKIDEKHGTPKNAMIFCIIVSLAGPILGREALGWFVDMSAIGASIGFMFTSLAAFRISKRDGDGSGALRVFAVMGAVFSLTFIVLQLIPIPGLDGVHFSWQSYVMLGVWVALGVAFYIKQRKKMNVLN
ncbi:MAG: APC family permease [Clostridia bacterium]|nr:APC family permease [Clostridia bacterium]